MFIPFILDLKYERHKSNAVYLNFTVNHSIIIEDNNFIKRVSYVLYINYQLFYQNNIVPALQMLLCCLNIIQ